MIQESVRLEHELVVADAAWSEHDGAVDEVIVARVLEVFSRFFFFLFFITLEHRVE